MTSIFFDTFAFNKTRKISKSNFNQSNTNTSLWLCVGFNVAVCIGTIIYLKKIYTQYSKTVNKLRKYEDNSNKINKKQNNTSKTPPTQLNFTLPCSCVIDVDDLLIKDTSEHICAKQNLNNYTASIDNNLSDLQKLIAYYQR